MRLYFFRRTFRKCCLSSQRGELKSVTMNDTTTKNQRRSGKRERERKEGEEEKKGELLRVRKRSGETRVTDREGSDLREWHQSAGLMRLAAITCISTAWRGRDLRKRYWMYKPKRRERGKRNSTVEHEERLVEYRERDVGKKERKRGSEKRKRRDENTRGQSDDRQCDKWGWPDEGSRVNTSATC